MLVFCVNLMSFVCFGKESTAEFCFWFECFWLGICEDIMTGHYVLSGWFTLLSDHETGLRQFADSAILVVS